MNRKIVRILGMLALYAAFLPARGLFAQVTTGSIGGMVLDQSRNPIGGASVIAVHDPSGTRYGALTRSDGRYVLTGLRVGGPYRVSVTYIGYEIKDEQNIYVNLGTSTTVNFTASQTAVALEGVTVTAERAEIMSPERTGAATAVTRDVLATVPALSARLQDVARLTPQSGGGLSFAGQDPRLNNISVDGSYFNNSFGLRNAPGETSGVAPISMSAIEQVQINVAPYDVRQGNFVGAAVNTVTRSGTNNMRGSLFYSLRNENFVGKEPGSNTYDPGVFNFKNVGGWLSGPIVKDKLFFFASYEDEALKAPGTTFKANTGGQQVGGNVTRVLASDLDALSTFLKTKFDYETGPYQDYDGETPAKRYLAKVDYNLNDRNKLSLRYNRLDSFTDVLLSNSTSLGFGNRRTSQFGLNFQNSNYQILENIRSLVGEWNSVIGTNMANQLIAGYTTQDESRATRGTFFPFVDILNGGSVYTSFGFEPFTPNNELRYKTFQVQNNFTIFGDKHDITFGVSGERYNSENVFFQGAQSVYVYNSLQDFYTDANDYLANPNRTTSPITLERFQVGYNNIPTNTKPIAPLNVFYGGVYAQDDWRVRDNLKVIAGVRVEAAFFGKTGYDNPNADQLNFRDEDGNTVHYNTGDLPGAKPLISPRIGFNWDARNDRSLQVRGGTGVFTGKPAFVWISNQISNTGMLTGFSDVRNTNTRPFHPDPSHYKPTNITGAPATSYALAVTDEDFKFPQIWRTNIGVDKTLPLGFIGTAEYIYNRDVNGIYYINANLPAAQSAFSGPDNRPRWTNNRINGASPNNISSAVVMKNQNVGRSWNIAGSLEKPFSNGLFVKAAYSYGEARNTVDPGSIAAGTWQNNSHSGDPNNPGLGLSANSPGRRLFATASYRRQWFSFGATTVSMFWSTRDVGNASYTFASDMNGDGGTNDLIYVAKDQSEMNFQQYTQAASGNTPARTFTAAEQAVAWDAYIKQDEYLSTRRGQYAERGAVWLPRVTRADMAVAQELFTNVGGKRNSVSVRADIINVGNLLNNDWGIGWRMWSNQPLTSPSVDATGKSTYRLRAINPTGTKHELMSKTFDRPAGRPDVWEIGVSLSYTFN